MKNGPKKNNNEYLDEDVISDDIFGDEEDEFDEFDEEEAYTNGGNDPLYGYGDNDFGETDYEQKAFAEAYVRRLGY